MAMLNNQRVLDLLGGWDHHLVNSRKIPQNPKLCIEVAMAPGRAKARAWARKME